MENQPTQSKAKGLEANGVTLAMPDFVTKDSGKREEFSTGSKRDTDEGKPRYELVPAEAEYRVAMLYSRGADKYGVDNWMKGQPLYRLFGSMIRHALTWKLNKVLGIEDSEDHLAAVIWGAQVIMWTEKQIANGALPSELDDIPRG